ncbi:MAG: 16S rRNA (guanine(966)-N(2))-methyltransferase RsmD [Clostridia bacterium]|nr:16S rRNA (guanine(966)-N(2))-methyltransferase RsmD [Clostridia bacterium]
MRIIAGIRKGLKLSAPDGMGTRPTTDRVKESVFNIIQMHLPAERVLDLFAGSGALGIEALSRRSLHCVFVEHDRRAYNVTAQNIAAAKFRDNSELRFSDSLSYLDSNPAPFDIIFLDPPYNKGLLAVVLDKISQRNLLKDGGIIVVETEKGGELAEHPDFEIHKCVSYGKTVITILKTGI